MASEVGVLDIPPENIVIKERLHPGRIFLVDTAKGRIIADEEIKRELARAHPYARVAAAEPDADRGRAGGAVPAAARSRDRPAAPARVRLHAGGPAGSLLGPMASAGEEPIGSMGTDTPLAVLSERPRLLYDYFKQLFAQVTNPPLDAIREELVTSMESTIGPERQPAEARSRNPAGRSASRYPIIDNDQLAKLRHIALPGFRSVTLPMLYRAGGRGRSASSARSRRSRTQASAGRQGRRDDPDPVGSRRHAGVRADSEPAGDGRRPPSSGARRARARGARSSSNRATRAKCTTSRCSSATAPARSTRTWRSRRSTT